MRNSLLVKAATVNAGTEVKMNLSTYTNAGAVVILNIIANMQGVTDAKVYVHYTKDNAEGTTVWSDDVDEDHSEDLQYLRDKGAKDWLANVAECFFEGQDYDERGDGWYTQEGYTYRFHFDRVEIEFLTGISERELQKEFNSVGIKLNADWYEITRELDDEYTEIDPDEIAEYRQSGHPIYWKSEWDDGYDEDGVKLPEDLTGDEALRWTGECVAEWMLGEGKHRLVLDSEEIDEFEATGHIECPDDCFEEDEDGDIVFKEDVVCLIGTTIYSRLYIVKDTDGPQYDEEYESLAAAVVDGVMYHLRAYEQHDYREDVTFATRLFKDELADED